MRYGFAAALFMLLLTALVSNRSTMRSREAFQKVEQTREVLQQLEEMLIAMLNVETATRGYVVTGRPETLEPLQQGIERVAGSRKAVREATAGDVLEQRWLDLLEPLLEDKIKAAGHWVAVRKDQGLEAALADSEAIQGKASMDVIRQRIADLERIENQHLSERIGAARAADRNTSGVIFIGSLLAVLFVGLASLMVQRDAKLRMQAESEARAARDYAESIVHTVHEPLLVVDGDLRIRSANRSFYLRFLLTSGDVVGRRLADIVGWDIPALQERLKGLMADGTAIEEFELTHEFPGAGRRTMLIGGRHFVQPEPNAKMVLLVFADVTEKQQAVAEIIKLNADLQARAAELESSNRELEAFSYSVSHDLRAPVRHIHGFVDLLRKSKDEILSESGRRYLNTISDSARQMGRLIDDLLAFSRMGRLEMSRGTVDLNLLAESAVKSQQMEARDRNIVWKRDPLPMANGDSSLLSLVFENLVANAVKYSRPKNPAHIEIGGREENTEVIVFVRDDGVGFDMKYADKLFGVFQRLHRVEEFEGTGIGLANVRRIVTRHGGRTWAESQLGEGSTFYFSLPK